MKSLLPFLTGVAARIGNIIGTIVSLNLLVLGKVTSLRSKIKKLAREL